jgi:hypothetical protein
VAAHTPARSRIERQISGALRDTINAHGPIDVKLIGSAAKRVYGVLYGGNEAPAPEPPVNGHRLPLEAIKLTDKAVVIHVGDRVEVAPTKNKRGNSKHDGWTGEVRSMFQDRAGPTIEVTHPKGSPRYVQPDRIRGRKR